MLKGLGIMHRLVDRSLCPCFPSRYLLCRKAVSRSVADVKHVHHTTSLIHRVDDSVNVRFIPEKQVTKLLAFWDG